MTLKRYITELIKTVKRRRKLSDNDMLRLVIQNEELPNAISTKFNKTVKRRRKLSDNDMLRLVIQNEELPNAISTKFNKVQEDFKLADLEQVIRILELPLKEGCI